MQFIEGSFYHIYNRGNNKQTIFFKRENYLYFLSKMKKYLVPCTDIIAWCLMPNHFHFLIYANSGTCQTIKQSPIEINAFTEALRLLLSSYTKGIQKQELLTGNLFQQQTKSKCVDDYLTTAFHYIHQNAFRAQLVTKIEDWEFSSFQEYLNKRKEFCNLELAFQFMDIDQEKILQDSYAVMPEGFVKFIF